MVEQPNGRDGEDAGVYEFGRHGGLNRRGVNKGGGWVDHPDGPREAGFLDGFDIVLNLADLLGLIVSHVENGLNSEGEG